MRRARPACDDPWVQQTAQPSRPPVAAPAARLYRTARGRLLGGVAHGLATHLGIGPLPVRIAFLVLTLTGFVGPVAYAAFWVLVPLEPVTESATTTPARPSRSPLVVDTLRRPGVLLPLAAILVGALLLLDQFGTGLTGVAWPLLAVGGGVTIIWRQVDEIGQPVSGTRPWARWLHSAGGLLLIVAGAILFALSNGGWQLIRQGLLPALMTVVGLALISSPYWLRLLRELDAERARRIRSQERAEVAAHLHDSVLHTLTLIQRHAHDQREVLRLARAQERDLRAWLYRPTADADRTLAAGVERLAAEVEDAHGVTIEVVCVGDCPLDAGLSALLQAAREAMINAAKYAGEQPISVYAEVESDQVALFVRDRGPGFDLAEVDPDRLGVRQSIIGRMERHGGQARISSRPGEGTEVQLDMERGSGPQDSQEEGAAL